MSTVLVHGGAGDIPDSRVPLKIQGVKKAAREGYRILCENGSVLDAVQAAVRVMEDDEAFNAGRGSVLTERGSIEMDAIIMEGATLKTGAVAGVTEVANPVDVARLVMERTPHIFLAGSAAVQFAHQNGVPAIPEEDLITDFARQALDDYLHGRGEPTNEIGFVVLHSIDQFIRGIQIQVPLLKLCVVEGSRNKSNVSINYSQDYHQEGRHGTVGAVAVDSEGHVSCATSTGGMTGKMPGRVGDTPLVGCGGYCDDSVGACSATGHGETIARVCLCRHITGLMENGIGARDAAERALNYMRDRTGGTGGVIVVSNQADVGFHFTSKRMAWAYVKEYQLHYGINAGEDFVEPY